MNAVIERHPVSTYVALTFTISWGGVLIVVGPGGFPGTREQFERLLPLAALAMIVGPSVAMLLAMLMHRESHGQRADRWGPGARRTVAPDL